jgi:hypothetical protein
MPTATPTLGGPSAMCQTSDTFEMFLSESALAA